MTRTNSANRKSRNRITHRENADHLIQLSTDNLGYCPQSSANLSNLERKKKERNIRKRKIYKEKIKNYKKIPQSKKPSMFKVRAENNKQWLKRLSQNNSGFFNTYANVASLVVSNFLFCFPICLSFCFSLCNGVHDIKSVVFLTKSNCSNHPPFYKTSKAKLLSHIAFRSYYYHGNYKFTYAILSL